MIRKLLFWLLTAALLTSTACSRHSSEQPDRPGQPPKEDPALSDASMRISGPLLELNYDDGGILFSQSADGTISATRVSDGLGFEYNPSAPSFNINGVDYPVSSATLLADRDNTRWHRVNLSNIKDPVYIVVSL